MPLHIFLSDEVLLYFFVRVELVKIQIWFEFKLVCNLQKGSKIYKGFSIFLRRIGPNSRWRPSQPSPARGLHGLAVCRACTCEAKGIQPDNAESDPIGC
jgi:hypothetical protein